MAHVGPLTFIGLLGALGCLGLSVPVRDAAAALHVSLAESIIFHDVLGFRV